MNKERIKQTLAGISIASLLTSVSLTTVGCSSEKAGDAGDQDSTKVEAKASCGQGSCGQAKGDSAKSSCGQGSCGQAKQDSAKSSCSQ